MEDQATTWKGHSFTLLIFTGIVVLCSIFFILGMLVGRQQGRKIAEAATVEAALSAEAKPEPAEERPQVTFYDVDKALRPTLEPAPVTAPEPARRSAPAASVPPKPKNVLNYQIGVFSQASRAEKVLETVKKKGFKGFILAPGPGERNPLYRVQVGPFGDKGQAESARKKLEAAGYKPIVKE